MFPADGWYRWLRETDPDRITLVLARTDLQRWLDPALDGPTDLLDRVEPPVKPLELF